MGLVHTQGPLLVVACLVLFGCGTRPATDPEAPANSVSPRRVSEAVPGDSDDPAIWQHPEDPMQSLVLGTDKGGAVYVFDLEGRILKDRSVTGLGRMNNVDIEYGLELDGELTDIAAATDRDNAKVRIFSLPEMKPIDGGGIDAFEGDEAEHRRPMGLALYKRPSDGAIFAIVSRKAGPSGSYLWQYRLEDDGGGQVSLTKVRAFGGFSGQGEIEAIAIDDAMGYVYYSDENFGIRKYLADPDASNADRELAAFGREGFREDREGISIYPTGEGTGYLLISDQQAQAFRVFRREGTAEDPHLHEEVAVIPVEALESDGSDVTSSTFGDAFPGGLFVAMSDDRTFHYYAWQDLTKGLLPSSP